MDIWYSCIKLLMHLTILVYLQFVSDEIWSKIALQIQKATKICQMSDNILGFTEVVF